jgi:hypothetical protein
MVKTAQAGSVTTGFIPYTSLGIIRIKGARWDNTLTTGHYYINFYKDDKTYLGGQTVVQAFTADGSAFTKVSVEYDEATGVTTMNPAEMNKETAIGWAWHTGAFFRINAYGKGEDLIVTVNQEITD